MVVDSNFDVRDLLGCQPSSSLFKEYIKGLAAQSSAENADVPDVKSYTDIVYFNYYPLGVSLSFVPRDGYKLKMGMKRAELKDESLALDGIDIYNLPPSKPTDAQAKTRRTAELKYSTYPISPINLPLTAETKDKDGNVVERPSEISITPQTSGKEFVHALGEPDKKGGGAGPSSGSIGIFCSWSKDGIMVEFGGQEAIGPQAWERGKDAVWRVVTIFPAEQT
ncbi:hypothetical protein EYR40_003879 [Pleurotus pulmonarius]|nr:hypothetical protein EYR40_003879 [Pleurotus pulmonarius]KAF4606587.1 hypothetical protein EYR38_000641 [Pleurotus pulmonarius]